MAAVEKGKNSGHLADRTLHGEPAAITKTKEGKETINKISEKWEIVQKELPESAYNDTELLEKHNIVTTTLEKVWNWGRSHSFWPVNYGCNCCPMEMMTAADHRYDISRFGYEVFRSSPRQADLLLLCGPITLKMEPVIKRVWAQMPAPKYVLCYGNCAVSGGPFKDGYSVLPGADSIFKVDVYVPGCPPRPEALFYGLLELKEKVAHLV